MCPARWSTHPHPLPLPPRNALNPFNFTTAAVRKRDGTYADDCLIYVRMPPQWSMSGRGGFAECVSAPVEGCGGWMKLKSPSSPSLSRESGWNGTRWKIVNGKGGEKKWNVCWITDRTYPSGKEPTGGVWKGLASCCSLDAVAVVQAGQIFLTTTETEINLVLYFNVDIPLGSDDVLSWSFLCLFFKLLWASFLLISRIYLESKQIIEKNEKWRPTEIENWKLKI